MMSSAAAPESVPESVALADSVISWLGARLPSEWTLVAAPSIVVDREEITVTLTIPAPSTGADAPDAPTGELSDARITAFRAETRDRRMSIARQAEQRFERKVAWAVVCDGRMESFTNLAAPVMTRLRQPERQVLDTLIDANVARSRADALAWCVRLVGKNTDEWLGALRDALRTVEHVRSTGPDVR